MLPLTSGAGEPKPPVEIEHNLSRIGITNEVTSNRVQAEIGAMSVELAQQKLRDQRTANIEKIRNQFCDQPPTNALCAIQPNDNTDFSELFVYMFILDTAQDPFDIFSWQSFVSLNWPLDESNEPAQVAIGAIPEAARVWSTFKTPRELFDSNYQDTVCGDRTDKGQPILRSSTWLQTGGYPLIDNNLNYVVYDMRVNNAMADYVLQNGLDTLEGQIAFAGSGEDVTFPMGYYDDPIDKTGGAPGSIAIKSAWKIIDESAGDDASRYYTLPGLVAVDGAASETGEEFCVEATLGLVGMHIMRRTKSGNGPEWTWSTFEHVDNSPDATNARKPVDTLHNELFPNGCLGPDQLDRDYAFYRPGCKDCATNHLDLADWKWATQPPYASRFATRGSFGSQVVRCWKIFEGTGLVNDLWREKLSGTVWANYQSTSAQWRGAKKSMMFPEGEVPRFLINTTMETYEQASSDSSCLGCHTRARSAAGQPSNFTFLLSQVSRYQLSQKPKPVAPLVQK